MPTAGTIGANFPATNWMSAIRLFINEQPCAVPPGATVRDAVAAFDSKLASQLDAGRAYVTDGRAIELDVTSPVTVGSILRVVVSRRNAES